MTDVINTGDQVHIHNTKGVEVATGVATVYGLGDFALVRVPVEIMGLSTTYTFWRTSAYKNNDGKWCYYAT